jgi:hypothetical protein
VGKGSVRGGGGKPGAEPKEGVEDERVIGDGGVVLSQGVSEVLLVAAVLKDRGGALEELLKLVVEVYLETGFRPAL